MARQVDKRKTRKALRRLKRVADRVESVDAPKLTDWEKEFVAGVSQRLETYGSAFRDPAKGALDEALSQRQTQIARVLERKSRPKLEGVKSGAEMAEAASKSPPKAHKSLQRKSPMRQGQGLGKGRQNRALQGKPPVNPRIRDINDDLPAKPALRIIHGGVRGGVRAGVRGRVRGGRALKPGEGGE